MPNRFGIKILKKNAHEAHKLWLLVGKPKNGPVFEKNKIYIS